MFLQAVTRYGHVILPWISDIPWNYLFFGEFRKINSCIRHEKIMNFLKWSQNISEFYQPVANFIKQSRKNQRISSITRGIKLRILSISQEINHEFRHIIAVNICEFCQEVMNSAVSHEICKFFSKGITKKNKTLLSDYLLTEVATKLTVFNIFHPQYESQIL